MILIDNLSNQVIVSSVVIEWKADHYEADKKRYFGGLSPDNCTLIADVNIPYGQANQWLYQNGQLTLTNTGLEARKEEKRSAIRQAFAEQENAPVEVNSVFWNGGYESAQKLDGVKRMAEMLSQTSVTFYDVDNIGHTMTIPESEIIITAIGVDYQTKFAYKQAKLVEVDNANSITELEDVVF